MSMHVVEFMPKCSEGTHAWVKGYHHLDTCNFIFEIVCACFLWEILWDNGTFHLYIAPEMPHEH